MEKNKELIIKPSIDSQGGLNVKVLKVGTQINEILKEYKNNYIIQKMIEQSEELAKIHNKSINTIRIISLLHNNEVIILSSVLRMGRENSRVDNFSSGGIACGIDENGRLKKYAYDKHFNKVEEHHPGFKFEGYEIKGYDKIKDIIKEQHKRFGHFKLISWDFTIGKDYEPIFIEFNLKRGGIDIHQACNGPLFGDLTDEILNEVFNKER